MALTTCDLTNTENEQQHERITKFVETIIEEDILNQVYKKGIKSTIHWLSFPHAVLEENLNCSVVTINSLQRLLQSQDLRSG